eukprot:COSAG01_NODE_29697_length_632_cov_0.547842_1_plen_66_part_10
MCRALSHGGLKLCLWAGGMLALAALLVSAARVAAASPLSKACNCSATIPGNVGAGSLSGKQKAETQ